MKKISMSEAEREKKVNIALVCLVITVVTCLPLFTDFLLCGTKLSYQLIRIEALKDALQQYSLHLWAKPEWIHPSGLSFVFYYGDTFLYIPAVMNLLGLSVQTSYRIFLILINIMTVLVSYKVFEKMFQDKYIGVLGSALYSASIYRMFLLYGEAELGEILALIFLPIVLYGCYLMFVRENEKWAYLWIAIGLSGMLRSHILSVGIAILFVLILAIIYIKRYREKFVWIQTGLTILTVALLNLNYLYTMFRYVTCGRYQINPFAGQRIQTNGIQPAQLFMCFYQAGGSHEFGVNGISDAVPVGIGFSLFVGIMTFLYLMFVYRVDYDKNIKRNGWIAFSIGTIASFCSTLCFPWDSMAELGAATATIVSMIWQPWHFLQIGLLAFTVLGCMTYLMVRQKDILYGKLYGVASVVAALLFSSYLAANMLFTYDFIRVYVQEEIPYAEIAGMGIQVEPMHNTWYFCTGIVIITLIANVVLYTRDNKRNL